jgi:hypothetical protein
MRTLLPKVKNGVENFCFGEVSPNRTEKLKQWSLNPTQLTMEPGLLNLSTVILIRKLNYCRIPQRKLSSDRAYLFNENPHFRQLGKNQV